MLTGIVYHGVDLDGYASGAIVADYLERMQHVRPISCVDDHDPMTDQYVFIPANYDWDMDIDAINKCDSIFVVDFTFQNKDWAKLDVDYIVWNDHHIKNYERAIAAKPELESLPGNRRPDKAGIGLIWEFLYSDKPLPPVLQLLNDYDIWNHKGDYDWDSVILPFQMGMKIDDWDPKKVMDKWIDHRHIIFNGIEETGLFISDTIHFGKVIEKYREEQYRIFDRGRIIEADMFDRKCLVLNTTNICSAVFGKQINEAELCIAYKRNKTGTWRIGFYSAAAHINCADIAAIFEGGGGHPGAAGCTISHKQWKELFNG